MQGTLWSTWGSIEKTSFRAEDIINWFPHLHSKDLLHKTFGPSNWDKKLTNLIGFSFFRYWMCNKKLKQISGSTKYIWDQETISLIYYKRLSKTALLPNLRNSNIALGHKTLDKCWSLTQMQTKESFHCDTSWSFH